MNDTLSAGRAHTLEQDIIYALPPKTMFILSTLAIEVSNSVDSGFAAFAGGHTTGAFTSARFLRCTGGAAVVSVTVDTFQFQALVTSIAALALRVSDLEDELAAAHDGDVVIAGSVFAYTDGLLTGVS
jgi:hypothetical protein